jgi:hypothetical protein
MLAKNQLKDVMLEMVDSLSVPANLKTFLLNPDSECH